MASGATKAARSASNGIDVAQLTRILEEGYGPGAWHGANMKAALEDVSPELAYWRPNPKRHSIAEIALHHAYCTRGARAKLTGETPEAFVLPGDDWFPLASEKTVAWAKVMESVEREHRRLVAALGGKPGRGTPGPLKAGEVFDLVLGITCHAVYHAGQIQLLKRLRSEG